MNNPNADHSCGPDCQCHVTSFEAVLFVYGYPQDGLILSRATVQKMADVLIGTQSRMLDGYIGQLLRIVSIRLEDDTPSDPTKGRVIAICEPVQPPSNQPYRPQGMETK